MNTELLEETDLRIAKTICEFAYAGSEPPVELIKSILARLADIPVEAFDSKTRKREIVIPRQVGMWYLVRIKDQSIKKSTLASIGESFGGKDHATVLHASREINNKLDVKEPIVVRLVNGLKIELLKLNKDFIV